MTCLRLADGETADRIALEVHVAQRRGRFDAQPRNIAALDDAEDRLARLVAEGRSWTAPPSAATGCIARSMSSASEAGSATHSSSCIWMSLSSNPWISTERSGVSS